MMTPYINLTNLVIWDFNVCDYCFNNSISVHETLTHSAYSQIDKYKRTYVEATVVLK